MWLIEQVRSRNYEKVCELLEDGESANMRESPQSRHDIFGTNYAALHIAVLKNDLKMVKILVTYHASVGALTREGQSPLHLASEQGYLDIVEYLISNGANVNLGSAERTGSAINTPSSLRGKTALHYAAKPGHLDVVTYLLENGADVNRPDSNQVLPVHEASAGGDLETVKCLVALGAHINAEDNSKMSPLHHATVNGHAEVVEYLLDNEANFKARDSQGWTPIYSALRKGYTEAAEYLIQKGADLNEKDKSGWTLLHHAVRENKCQSVQYLLGKGVSVNERDKSGWTPLHCALKWSHDDIMKTLVAGGADTNVGDGYGWTALHHAASAGKLDVVKYLLREGANVNAKDNSERDPYDCCYYYDIKQYLSRFKETGTLDAEVTNTDEKSEEHMESDESEEEEVAKADSSKDVTASQTAKDVGDGDASDDDICVEEHGGSPTEDELVDIAAAVGTIIQFQHLCKSLAVSEKTELEYLNEGYSPHDVLQLAIECLGSWNKNVQNPEEKIKILKTLTEYKQLQCIKDDAETKLDAILDELPTKVTTFSQLVIMVVSGLDARLPLDIPLEKRQRVVLPMLRDWVKVGGKRAELLRGLQAAHLTGPAEVVSSAMQRQPDLAGSFTYSTVDHEGGNLQLESGDVQMKIPTGALPKDTPEVVTIRIPTKSPKISAGTGEFQVSPAVQCSPDGLEFKRPVRITVPHCTSPEKIQEDTRVILYGSDGSGGYDRDELPPDDYDISNDSIEINVNRFSEFAIFLKNVGGLKVGCLPFHPVFMPPSRKPILQVCLYHLYERNEKKLRNDQRNLHQPYCEATSPVEFFVEPSNEDLTVQCLKDNKDDSRLIPFDRVLKQELHKVSFEMEFKEEESGCKNIHLSLGQGSSPLQTQIFQTTIQDQTGTENVSQESNCGEERNIDHGRVSGAFKHEQDIISDRMLIDLSNEIPNSHLMKLGIALKFTLAEIKRFDQTNMRGTSVTSDGTLTMLQEWNMKTSRDGKLELLRTALIDAELAELADKHFPIKRDKGGCEFLERRESAEAGGREGATDTTLKAQQDGDDVDETLGKPEEGANHQATMLACTGDGVDEIEESTHRLDDKGAHSSTEDLKEMVDVKEERGEELIISQQEGIGERERTERAEEEPELGVLVADNILSKTGKEGDENASEERINNLQEQVVALQLRCDELEQSNHTIQKRCDALDQSIRKNCLRFHGIPEREGEDTDELVSQVVSGYMSINLLPCDIDCSYRLSTKVTVPLKVASRAIVVRFTRYRVRQNVYRERRKLEGTDMFVCEDLTQSRQDLLARACASAGVQRAWSEDGHIMVLTTSNIEAMVSTEEDIKHIDAV